MIPLFNTYIHHSAKEKIGSVLDTTFLSEGSVVKEFEDRLAHELGCINPVALNSGTSALHLALILAGVGPGDEVILPAQTFISTGMAILYLRAIPVFADIQYETGNIDTKSIEQKITKKTKAIMPVHWLGYPCDMDEILAIAKQHNLAVIEDAAHAPGATYRDKPIGALSDYTCFSFQAIKHIPTGDGGAICTLDSKVAAEAKRLRWLGIDRERDKPSFEGDRMFNIPTVGYKYHMNNYAAALGLANLENFKERLALRRKHAALFRTAFADSAGATMLAYRDDRESSFWTFSMHVERRHDFIKAMKDRGIQVSNVNFRIDQNAVFGGLRDDLAHQARYDQTQISIPVHDGLTEEQVSHIISSVQLGW